MKAYVPLMSERVLGERLQADEAITTLALQHRKPLDFSREGYSHDELEQWAMSMIRTGAIYVVERKELSPAWNTLWDVPVDELPPLPFPRIVIEAEEDGKPILFQTAEKDGHNITFKLVEILEVEQGVVWNICIVIQMDDGSQTYFCFGTDKSRSGEGLATVWPLAFVDVYNIENEQVQKEMQVFSGLFLRYIVNSVHLITARNTPKEHVSLPRPQRRQFKRKYGIEHPSVYRVRLDQAGDAEGVSGWHYKVRFLVCGHWRHFGDGTRSWVRPHIKGPAGAPWKGRPVHEKSQTSEIA